MFKFFVLGIDVFVDLIEYYVEFDEFFDNFDLGDFFLRVFFK